MASGGGLDRGLMEPLLVLNSGGETLFRPASEDGGHGYQLFPAETFLFPDTVQRTASGAGSSVSPQYQEVLRMGAWSGMLCLGYVLTRFCVLYARLPSDGVRIWSAADFSDDISRLLAYGVVLGWLVGVTQPDRAAWLFSRRRLWLWVVYLGTQPCFAAFGEVKGLQHSLADLSQWGTLAWTIIPAALALGAACAVWHVWHACRALKPMECALYAGSRLGTLIFYVLSYTLFEKQRRDTPGSAFHLHHLYIGWLLAMWGAFNHPLSGGLLAVATGIFVQGVAAYDFADLFCDARCSVRGG